MQDMMIKPDIFSPYPNLLALQTTRHGGISDEPFASLNLGHNTRDTPENTRMNRQILCNHAGIHPSSLVTADQVHGTKVLHAREGGHYSGYDAFITDRAGLYLCILTADCFPVLIYDRERNVVGAAHAGWQGSAANVAGKTLSAMREGFGTKPSSCLAWIGTGISAAAYEVGREVASRFESRHTEPNPSGTCQLDLSSVNRQQLIHGGLADTTIATSPFCTVRNNNDYYSYRKENGNTGRMMALIGIIPDGTAP